MPITHAFVSAKADSGAALALGKVLPSYWNAAHVGNGLDIVNVKDFGAVGNNVADDTAAIQAAIDYAITNHSQVVYIPPGKYKITSSLYMDPPTGLRTNLGSPADFQFSLTLTGADGLPNQEQDGTTIYPTFDNTVAIYVGAGQGMKLANMTISGPGGQYRGNQTATGVGVGLTGTGGGSSRTTIENVGVFNFYAGFMTSANGNGTLGDSNTFIKCFTGNVYYGFYIAGLQNFINSFYDCNPNNATVCLYNPYNNGCRVFGGNWSSNSGVAAYYPISSTSALSAAAAGNSFNYSFTTTVASIDAGLSLGGVFNAFAIKTASFGLIPLTISNLNTGTGVATFTIVGFWSYFHYIGTNAVSTTDLSAEIQACARVYAAELVTTFWGEAISVNGVHIENAYASTTMIRAASGFGTTIPSTYRNIQFNYDPSLADLKASTDPSQDLARFYIQQSWPFIWLQGAGDVAIEDCELGVQHTEPVNITVETTATLKMRGLSLFARANIIAGGLANYAFRSTTGAQFSFAQSSPGFGAGEYDSPITFSSAGKQGASYGDYWRSTSTGWGKSPMWGVRPAPWARPVITPQQLGIMTSTVGSPTYSGGNWDVKAPPIWGGQVHSVYDWYTAATEQYEIISNHHFYTYGVDLAAANISGLSWSYKGQSNCVYADARTLELMFPGLGIKLFDGSSNIQYIVTGVYNALGYFTVFKADTAAGGNLSGNKTTTFTGTTIFSEPFLVSVVSGPKTPVTKTADFAPTPLENNLIVNKAGTTTVTLPTAASYTGRSITLRTIQAQTVVSASSDVVPGAGGSAGTAILAATAGKWAELISDGINWQITKAN